MGRHNSGYISPSTSERNVGMSMRSTLPTRYAKLHEAHGLLRAAEGAIHTGNRVIAKAWISQAAVICRDLLQEFRGVREANALDFEDLCEPTGMRDSTDA